MWELIIQGSIAVGTISVAVLAIWGDWVRGKLAGPKLELALHNPEGKTNTVTDGTLVRYYHLKVKNKRRWAPAKNVRVLLTKVHKPAADGSFPTDTLSGPLQLTWQFPQFHPLFPTIGPEDICDLGNLQKGGEFVLSPYVIPNNFQGILSSAGKFRIELIAAGDNAESDPFFVEISWDGQWKDGDHEMRQHLVVREISSLEA